MTYYMIELTVHTVVDSDLLADDLVFSTVSSPASLESRSSSTIYTQHEVLVID